MLADRTPPLTPRAGAPPLARRPVYFLEIDMFQAKLVNPNGSPKAIVATHDRVASGKEFALFQQLLSMMAIGCVPADTFDPSGHQMSRLIEPDELVRRAEEIVLYAMERAESNAWAIETADIDKIYQDVDADSPGAGFRFAVAATPDDIPF